jgi:hypothetical protein
MNSLIDIEEEYDSDCTDFGEIESPIIDMSYSHNITKDRIEESNLVNGEVWDDNNNENKSSSNQPSSYLSILSEIDQLIVPITSTKFSNKQKEKSRFINNKNNNSIINEKNESKNKESSLLEHVQQNSKSYHSNVNNSNENEKDYDALTQVEEMLLQTPQSLSQSQSQGYILKGSGDENILQPINNEIINEINNNTEATSNESFDMEVIGINNLSPPIKISSSDQNPIITNEISDRIVNIDRIITQKISKPLKLKDPSKVIENAIFTLNKLIKNQKKFMINTISIDLMLKVLIKSDALNLNTYLFHINHIDRVKGLEKMVRLTYFTLLHKPLREGVFNSLLNNK